MSFALNPREDFRYVGEFWFPESENEKYFGFVEYSSEKGIYLSIRKEGGLLDISDDQSTIYGNVERIGKITLINCMFAGGSGSFSCASIHYNVVHAIEGNCANLKEKIFERIIFHFKQLDNFCFPFENGYEIFKNEKKFHATIENFGTITLGQWLQKDASVCLKYVYWGEQGEQIKKVFNDDEIISKSHYGIAIKTEPTTFSQIMKMKTMIERLFSVFLMERVEMDDCQIFINGRPYQFIFKMPSFSTSGRIMAQMPICVHSIESNFQDIFAEWIKIYENSLLIDCLLNRLYRNCGHGYQQFNMILSQCAFFQIRYGKNKCNGKRYENFVEETLSEGTSFSKNISFYLEEIFADIAIENDKESYHRKIGYLLGNLRDYIAHADTIPPESEKGKIFKKYAGTDVQINRLCEILFVMLIKRIYNKIGIKQTNLQEDNLIYMGHTFKMLDV